MYHTHSCVAELFSIAKEGNNANTAMAGYKIMKYCPSTKKKRLFLFATWMKLEVTVLSEMSQAQKHRY